MAALASVCVVVGVGPGNGVALARHFFMPRDTGSLCGDATAAVMTFESSLLSRVGRFVGRWPQKPNTAFKQRAAPPSVAEHRRSRSDDRGRRGLG
jgi:hypothetical protein